MQDRGLGWPDRSTSELRTTKLVGVRTEGADDTRALAEVVAGALRPGDVISLSGDLGAGKTCFVQGAAAGLGVDRRVTSPTFNIVRSYPARCDGQEIDLVHVDVYRLDRLQDVVELGEETVLGPDQITFIEWGDAVRSLLPSERLEVELHHADEQSPGVHDQRRIELRGHGTWAGRLDELAGELAHWLAAGEDGGA